MKILHVTGALNMGGAEVMLMDFLRFKSDDVHLDFVINHHVKLGIPKGDFDEEIKSKGSELYYIPTQWEIGPLEYAKQFKAICKRALPDIVHIHLNAKSGIIAWAARKAGINHVIIHSHADLKIRGHWLKVFLSNLELKFQKFLIARYGTHFWGCSIEANKSLFYERLLDDKKSAVINNAIDAEKFIYRSDSKVNLLKESYGFDEDTLVLGNVGRVVRHKNITFVLDLLATLKAEGKKAGFVFAGRDSDQEYMAEFWQEAENLGIKESIVHLGVREDIEIVMSAFDVFVGPALQEGFGLVAVEAQAAGIPTILYQGFPKSVDVGLGLVHFLTDFDTSNWVNKILSPTRIVVQKDRLKAIQELGLDANQNTKQVEEMYMTI